LLTYRDEADLIPSGAKWIKSAVTQFVPEENAVVTSDGHTVHYKYLVVCPGIQINWDNVLLSYSLSLHVSLRQTIHMCPR
jgi:sulfide:quinone oxidoreductase